MNSGEQQHGTRPSAVERATVLVVDDERLNREMLAALVRRGGHDVVMAGSGLEAIHLVRSRSLDAVILDVVMPDLDGIDVLREVRATHTPIELPIIMCTANHETEQLVTAFSAGANDYVTKPLNVAVVLARLATHLESKRMQAKLRESEERYALAARGANDGLWDWDLRSDEVYYSPRWQAMIGHEEGGMRAHPDEWLSRIHDGDRPRVEEALAQHREGGVAHFETEFRMLHRDGGYRWMLCRGLAVRDARERATRIAGSLTDITHAKVSDGLTGLPNRIMFLDRLARSIVQARATPGSLLAVLFVDVDNFKLINDSLGHEAGDHLLMGLAHRLSSCVRTSDVVVRPDSAASVARLGGDEFTILLERIECPTTASNAAQRILAALREPFTLLGRPVFVGASIGITVGVGDERGAEDLLREADTAMYHAKSLGRSRYALFDPAMLERVRERLALESDLRLAMHRGEFELHYQPIVRLADGHVAGFEALLRWRHPTRGMIPPAEFIPIAEQTSLIVPLGEWVLREACSQAARWQREFPSDPPLLINVNCSCRQFMTENFLDTVQDVLDETNIDPRGLKLEVTETTLMENSDAVAALMARLRERKVQVGLDDFGTGFSSLSMLHRFPLDVLKIDRSFVQQLAAGREHAAIVRTIISLSRTLDLDVVAEGIETRQQRDTLLRMGCVLGQGYLFSRPLATADAHAFLENQRASVVRLEWEFTTLAGLETV